MCDKILIVPAWYPCSFFKEQVDVFSSDCNVALLSGSMHKIELGKAILKKDIKEIKITKEDDCTYIDFNYVKNLRSVFFTKQIDDLAEKIGEIIVDLFGNEKPDIVHIQSISDIAVFVTKWAKKYNVRVILTEHILFIRHEITPFSRLRENVYNEVDEVLCVSNYLCRNLITSGFQIKQLSVIGNFVNDKYVEQNRLYKKNGRILFVANHYHDKGLDVLLEVVKKLQHKLNVVVDVIGLDQNSNFNSTSIVADKFKEYEEKNKICFLGRMEHHDLLQLYSQYSILLSTSTSETFGLAVAEAIMYGTKVVCTDSGGIRDFVNERNGMIVGLNDVEGLVEAIINSFENSRIDDAAMETIREKYGIEVYKKNILKHYNK